MNSNLESTIQTHREAIIECLIAAQDHRYGVVKQLSLTLAVTDPHDPDRSALIDLAAHASELAKTADAQFGMACQTLNTEERYTLPCPHN